MTEDQTRRDVETGQVGCPRCSAESGGWITHLAEMELVDGHPVVTWLEPHAPPTPPPTRDQAIERLGALAGEAFGQFADHPAVASKFLDSALSVNDSQPQPRNEDER